LFSEPAAPKILKTNQFYFLLSQDCVACNIQVVKIRQSMLQAAEPKDETLGWTPMREWQRSICILKAN